MGEPTIDHLRVVVAHHADNEFYDLGRLMSAAGGAMLDWNGAVIADVTHEVPPAALFAAITDAECERVDGRSTCEHMCVMLDARDANGDIIADKEITAADADRLLDGEFEQRLEAARGNLAAYYDSVDHLGHRAAGDAALASAAENLAAAYPRGDAR